MSNTNYTVITGNDKERFDEITKNLEFRNLYEIRREPGLIIAQTVWISPFEEIKALSKKYPAIIFSAVYTLESDGWDTEYHYQFKSGNAEFIGVKPNYQFPYLEWLKQEVPCFDELFERIMEIFRRVDPVVDDPEKGERIDWCLDEVTAVVEKDRYRMSAKKGGNRIENIQCFHKKENNESEWVEVEKETHNPFFFAKSLLEESQRWSSNGG